MGLSTPSLLFILSAASIVIALGLTGGSLAKSVKWNSYDSGTNWGTKGGPITKLYAFQTLWTSYDRSGGQLGEYAPAYTPVTHDSWRELPRILIMVSLPLGAVSLLVLLSGSLIPLMSKRAFLLNGCRIASSVLSVGNGGLLSYTLYYYYTHYPLLKSEWFRDPTSMYPEEDNVSAGFFMATFGCVLYFTSAVLNIVNVVKLIKENKNTVNPTDNDKAQQTK